MRIAPTPVWLARPLPVFMPSLPAPLVDVMLAAAVGTGHPAESARLFGVLLHTLAEVWDEHPDLSRAARSAGAR